MRDIRNLAVILGAILSLICSLVYDSKVLAGCSGEVKPNESKFFDSTGEKLSWQSASTLKLDVAGEKIQGEICIAYSSEDLLKLYGMKFIVDGIELVYGFNHDNAVYQIFDKKKLVDAGVGNLVSTSLIPNINFASIALINSKYLTFNHNSTLAELVQKPKPIRDLDSKNHLTTYEIHMQLVGSVSSSSFIWQPKPIGLNFVITNIWNTDLERRQISISYGYDNLSESKFLNNLYLDLQAIYTAGAPTGAKLSRVFADLFEFNLDDFTSLINRVSEIDIGYKEHDSFSLPKEFKLLRLDRAEQIYRNKANAKLRAEVNTNLANVNIKL